MEALKQHKNSSTMESAKALGKVMKPAEKVIVYAMGTGSVVNKVGVTLPWDAIQGNRQDSLVNGVWTCPVSGDYTVSASIMFGHDGDSMVKSSVKAYKNGNEIKTFYSMGKNGARNTISHTIFMSMDKGDTLKFVSENAGSINYVHFSGWARYNTLLIERKGDSDA